MKGLVAGVVCVLALVAAYGCSSSSDGGGSGGAAGAANGGSSVGGAANGGSSNGGTSSGGSSTGGGSSYGGASDGGSTGEGGGTGICPYTSALNCDSACDNLKTIAAKCQDDPSLSSNIKAVLAAAATGSGNGCKVTCAADSPQYTQQWECFQATPTEADCTAIAGCTAYNCPPNY